MWTVRRRRIVHMPIAIPGVKSTAPVSREVLAQQFQTSTGAAVDLRRPPRTSSVMRALRQALTRLCSVRSCALLPYISGSITTNRPIKALAGIKGSAFSQPSMTGHTSANGSVRVLHLCLALGCLRCVGRASPSFQADDKLKRNAATLVAPVGSTSVDTPQAVISLSVCCAVRISCSSRTGSRARRSSFRHACPATSWSRRSPPGSLRSRKATDGP